MRTRITKRDYELAMKATDESRSEVRANYGKALCCGCLIYQAATRRGLSSKFVSYEWIELNTGIIHRFGPNEKKITAASRNDWPSFIGKTITLPDVK